MLSGVAKYNRFWQVLWLCAQVFIRIEDDRKQYHNYGLLVIGVKQVDGVLVLI